MSMLLTAGHLLLCAIDPQLDASHFVLLLRCFTVAWSVATVFVAFSFKQYPGDLTEDMRRSIRRENAMVAPMGVVLTFLHAVDVQAMQASVPAGGLIAEETAAIARAAARAVAGILVVMRCLLALDALLVIAAFFARKHDGVPTNSTSSNCEVSMDLDSRSSAIEVCSEEMCSICLCSPVAGDVVTILPCGHEFHRSCVECWLRESGTCPFRCPASSVSSTN